MYVRSIDHYYEDMILQHQDIIYYYMYNKKFEWMSPEIKMHILQKQVLFFFSYSVQLIFLHHFLKPT